GPRCTGPPRLLVGMMRRRSDTRPILKELHFPFTPRGFTVWGRQLYSIRYSRPAESNSRLSGSSARNSFTSDSHCCRVFVPGSAVHVSFASGLSVGVKRRQSTQVSSADVYTAEVSTETATNNVALVILCLSQSARLAPIRSCAPTARPTDQGISPA